MGAAEHEAAVKQRHLVWGEGGVMSDEEEDEDEEQDEDDFGDDGQFGDGMADGGFGDDDAGAGEAEGAGAAGDGVGVGDGGAEMDGDKGTKPFVAAIAEMVAQSSDSVEALITEVKCYKLAQVSG